MTYAALVLAVLSLFEVICIALFIVSSCFPSAVNPTLWADEMFPYSFTGLEGVGGVHCNTASYNQDMKECCVRGLLFGTEAYHGAVNLELSMGTKKKLRKSNSNPMHHNPPYSTLLGFTRESLLYWNAYQLYGV